jgi:hypothetical protein
VNEVCLVGCFAKLSATRFYSIELLDDRRTGKDLEGSGRGQIAVLSRNLPEGSEKKYGKSESLPMLERRNSRMQV